MKRIVTLLAVLTVISALTACRSAGPVHFYVLKSTSEAGQAAPAAYRIEVGPVTVPAVVDRPQFATYDAANQISLPEQSRWGEPLAGGISRVVGENLAKLLGAQVSSSPQAVPDPNFRVVLDVQRFEAVLGNGATVDVLWTVRPKAKDGTIKTGSSSFHDAAAGSGYDGVVAAFDSALASVSADIAAAIRAMPAPAPALTPAP
jgi:uncharacterized protein